MTDTDATNIDSTDDLTARLLEAAKVVFARDGYSRARMQDIATEAGVSTGAIYNRFRGKAELFATLLRPLETEDIEAVMREADAAGKLADVLRTTHERLLHGRPVEMDALTAQALAGARSEPEAQRVALARLETSQSNHLAALLAGQRAGIYDEAIDAPALAGLITLARLGAAILNGLDAPIAADDAMRGLYDLLLVPDD